MQLQRLSPQEFEKAIVLFNKILDSNAKVKLYNYITLYDFLSSALNLVGIPVNLATDSAFRPTPVSAPN
jgi:hypothetical protein